MNNPSPLVPQGSLNTQGKKKLTLPVAVCMILSLHLLFLSVLLMQGCNRNTPKTKDDTGLAGSDTNNTSFPPYTNSISSLPTNNSPAPGGLTNFATGTRDPAVGASTVGTVAPADVKIPDATLSTEVKEYSVAKGDTLAKIAHRHGLSLAALKKANPDVLPQKLKVGQKIKIPSGGTSGGDAGATSGATGGTSAVTGGGAEISEGSSYTVKQGDTLTKIAKAHGVSAKKLRAHNGLTTDKIRVGQKLKIPARGSSSKEAATLKATDTMPGSPADTSASNPPAFPAVSTNTGR